MSSATTLSRLESLPPETLSQVLDLVVDGECNRSHKGWYTTRSAQTKQDLQSLCLVSKPIGEAATPYLYHFIDTTYFGEKSDIEKIVRTLVAKPEYVKHIRFLAISASSDFAPVSDETLRMFRSALWSLASTPVYGTLVHALSYGCHSAQALVLLQLTGNIRNLVISYVDHRPELNSIVARYWSSGRRPGKALEALKKLMSKNPCKYCPHMQDVIDCMVGLPSRGTAFSMLRNVQQKDRVLIVNDSLPVNSIRPFVRLPALESLSMEGLCSDEASSLMLEENFDLVRLSDLHLQDVVLRAEDIIKILEKCEDLKKLSITWAVKDGEDWSDRTEKAQPSELLEALQRHSNSLVELTLHSLRTVSWSFITRMPVNISLLPFRNLKKLEIDERVLTQAGFEELGALEYASFDDILPANLEHLTIHSGSDQPMELLLPVFWRCLGLWRGDIERQYMVTFPIHGITVLGLNDKWSSQLESLEETPEDNVSPLLLYRPGSYRQRICFFGHLDPEGKLGEQLLNWNHLLDDLDETQLLQSIIDDSADYKAFKEMRGIEMNDEEKSHKNRLRQLSGFYERLCVMYDESTGDDADGDEEDDQSEEADSENEESER